MMHPLHDLRLPGPTLVLVDDSDALALDALHGIEDVPGIEPRIVTVSTLDGPLKGWGSVLVVAADRARLRRMASAVPLLGQCKAVACWLTDAPTPWVLVPRPEWPRLLHLVAREAGDRGVLTVARFASGARAQLVVMEMARQAAGPGDTTHGGLVVAYAGRPAAPGLDARAPLLPDVAGAGDPDRDVPPDVVVARRAGSAQVEAAAHHVIDRAPTVVTDPGPEPVDERIFNPVGFRKDWDHPVVDLARIGSGPVTEGVVAAARAFQGVRLPADTPTADLLALAMSGVPVVSQGVLDVAPPLAAALDAEVDLDDALRREEHSLAVRRAAFDHHSTLAWRSALAARSGVRHVALPPVSALLSTKRPEMLDFALRQVARQRGAEVELVLAAHGFEPDRDAVRRALGDRPHQVLSFDETAFFGDVLTAAARAASSEVLLKIDDDDWYAPDAVHDLLMARRFSGADVVGMPSEFVFLHANEHRGDLTVRRNHPSELFARFVAGGTLLLDRGLLRSLGDFRRVRRFVDAQLLSGVEAAGGRIYRTHGLGYVLRRTGEGHTWVRDDEEFRRPDIVASEWEGFQPSLALEVDPLDRPGARGAVATHGGG
ncbi:glycosyltransferase family A protein [Nocardioides renjunii]|uniref:glycosyltransferase family A protein n=1 Tax=Nocardioides renjunii TaxID=3095075 RepID=UPI002AFF0294|nr:glycosyltransferase family A protein [Nocardioides sp. S-34]WQQ22237.1 glycosyltransferase family A protein [Nocardioides sp. S-34]